MNIIISSSDVYNSHIGDKVLSSLIREEFRCRLVEVLLYFKKLGCLELSVFPGSYLFKLSHYSSKEEWIDLKEFLDRFDGGEIFLKEDISLVLDASFYYCGERFKQGVENCARVYICVFCETSHLSERIGICSNKNCRIHEIRKAFEPGCFYK